MRNFQPISISILICLASLGLSAQNTTDKIDSTFQVLSLPELQSYRRYYLQELQSLHKEKNHLIQKGIGDGERLLSVNPNAKMADEILIRLADLYYFQSKDDYITRMDEYDQKLIESEGTGAVVTDPEPKLNCMKSLTLYQKIIDEMPGSDLVDDAVYNKAFLYEEIGENQIANDIYKYLIEAFPNSPYVPEAYMRLGEYYFNPPVSDLETAIKYYTKISKYKSNPRYSESLYKLGWSYYRLSDYAEAISYFTSLIEDVSLNKKYADEGEISRADLLEEALQYVAISFHDFGGSAKAVEYLDKIGRPDWGGEVLQKLGDVYMEQKEEYENGITAYKYFLDFIPTSSDAPKTLRKIVDCYLMLDDKQKAFEERHRLFLTYRKGSNWWNNTEDEGARLTAYSLTEQALRENIDLLIKIAGSGSDQSRYNEVIALGRTYLDNFPEDKYAYMVRWNIALILDTKLNMFKDALQEYLTICLVYNTGKYENFAREKGLSTIRDAAANAIVVSDSIVAAARRNEVKNENLAKLTAGEAVPLTTSESWQALAYDNYIKLFPFDEKNTPLILANAGALYHSHNLYSEALKYFNTLIQYFPKSDQISMVKLSILDSYFGKQDYKSAELLAKRILAAKPDKDVEKQVRKRLGEAVFLNAQSLAKNKDDLSAAKEYHRMALESPTMEFADRALFNAALHYEKAGDLQAAIGVYEKLCTVYTSSPLFVDALNNLAINYSETGDLKKSAYYYSALADRVNDGGKRRDALYNSFIFYEKSSAFPAAIKVGRKYVQEYADSSDAAGIYYKTGMCYLKIGQKPAAMEVFKSFPEKFPVSFLGVETGYRLGQYYEKEGDTKAAELAYRKAHDLGRKLLDNGREIDGYYISEALFHATKLMHKRFNQLKFVLPQAQFDNVLRQKQQLLSDLTTQYTLIAAYKTARLPEAVFCLGEIFEDFGISWKNQEMSTSLNNTESVVKEKSINERTIAIFERALSGYIKAITAISENKVSTPTQPKTSESDQLLPEANQLAWKSKAENKVSEILYEIAEINNQSLVRVMTTPVPPELNDIEKLEYRNQVLFKVARPLAEEIIISHLRNLQVADSLEIDNKWSRSSRMRIIDSSLLLFREYGRLSVDALTALKEISQRYHRESLVNGVKPPEEWPTGMINLTELYKTYSKAAAHFYGQGINKILENKVQIDKKTALYDDLVNFALTSADTIDILLVLEETFRAKSDKLFQQNDEVLFEEALTVFEDNIYFLEECRNVILETVLAKYKEMPDRGLYGNQLILRIINNDSTRIAEFASDIIQLNLATDTSWTYHPGLKENGLSALAGSKGWNHPVRTAAGLVWGRHQGESLEAVVVDTVLIRKTLQIPGRAISGKILTPAAKPIHLILNGNKVIANEKGEFIIPVEFFKQGFSDLIIMCKRDLNFSFYANLEIRYLPLPKLQGAER